MTEFINNLDKEEGKKTEFVKAITGSMNTYKTVVGPRDYDYVELLYEEIEYIGGEKQWN